MECEIVKDALQQWKENCQDIQAKMEQLCNEMKQALEEKDGKISELLEINNDLKDYIRQLEKPGYLLNKVKNVMEVEKNTRTIKTFMSRAKTALWFADSFGSDIHSITFKEQKTGKYNSLEAETTADASAGRLRWPTRE